MRVNLTIRRNRLEPVNVLWNIASNRHQSSADTISRFLTDVDEKFPLESDDWGLEDYVVDVNGFECLHYQTTAEILKDGDHVTIRPLETHDVRSRTLSGRHQISGSGLTLIDGIPFGRSFLRSLSRPKVHIPARKRRRLTVDDQPSLLLTEGADDARSVSISDIDGEEEQLLLLNSGEATLADKELSDRSSRRDGPKKVVRFNSVPETSLIEDEDEDSDEDEDEDFDPDDSDTDSESDEDDEEDQPLVSERTNAEDSARPSQSADSYSSSTSSPSNSSDSSLSESDSSSDSSSDEEPVAESPSPVKSEATRKRRSNGVGSLSHTPSRLQHELRITQVDDNSSTAALDAAQVVRAPPGEGKKKTQMRNLRRKETIRLQKLKANGVLGENASIQDLRELEADSKQNSSNSKMDKLESTSDAAQAVVERTPANSDLPEASFEVTFETTQIIPAKRKSKDKPKARVNGDKTAEFEAKREKLLQDLASGTIYVDDDGPPEQLSSKDPGSTSKTDVTTDLIDAPPSKRARLDVVASMRMIFGNLGQRVPKSRAEAEAVREKLAKKKEPVAPTPQKTQVEQLADPTAEPGSWKDRLILKAVECCEEGIELSTPPFPFVQRWDPQQKLEKKKAKKRKRAGRQSYQEDEQYEEYGDVDYEGNLDYSFVEMDGEQHEGPLDYGDAEAQIDLPASTQAYNDLAQDQLLNESQYSASSANEVDDLPPLPKMYQLKKRPATTQENLLPGAIIAFKQLECSAATKWSPQLSLYRTAVVLADDDVDKGAVALRLALRDREGAAPKEYDEDGRRVYNKFEMPLDELGVNGEDDGYRMLNIDELVEGKLVRAAPSEAQQTLNHKSGPEKDSPSTVKQEKSSETLLAESMEAAETAPEEANLGPKPEASEWNGIDDGLTDDALIASESGRQDIDAGDRLSAEGAVMI